MGEEFDRWRRAMLELDLEYARASLPEEMRAGASELVLLISLHKARYHSPHLPREPRLESAEWLRLNGWQGMAGQQLLPSGELPGDKVSENPVVNVPSMCGKHLWLLVKQARYAERDPWRALVVAANVALFQAATTDPRIQGLLAGDITRISGLGCLACQKPDSFGSIVEEAKSHNLGRVKALGERWLSEAAEKKQP